MKLGKSLISNAISSPIGLFTVMVFVILSVFLITGCISSTPATNHTRNTSMVMTLQKIVTSTPIPTLIQSPLENNSPSTGATVEMPFINIIPVTDHNLGDIIQFSGTTNLAPGKNLILMIFAQTMQQCNKCQSCDDSVEPCRRGIQQTVIVESNISGINTWSWDVNTSQHRFNWGTPYFIQVCTENNSICDYTKFKLKAR
jgi:hypothetical protein